MISSFKLQSGKEAEKSQVLRKKKKERQGRGGESRKEQGGSSLSCQGNQPLTGL